MRTNAPILVILALIFPAVPIFSEVPEVSLDPSSEFAVETRVFVGTALLPTVKTTTVFQAGRAYDIVEGPPESIARFDFEHDTVILVDPENRSRATIGFTEMLRFQAEMRARAQRRGGLVAFLAEPAFIREFDASKSTIELSSSWISYEAAGRQSASDVVEQFLDFADWSARLSSMLHPSAPPANARIALNEALRNQNWIGTRVTRSGGPKARMLGTLRSEHDYRFALNEEDRHLIQLVEKDLKSFKKISFSEFRKLQKSPRVAANE